MTGQDTDSALVARVQRGDKRAFDLLVKKYQHRLMALIGRYVRDRAEVADVAQEAFIKAYRALPNFRGDSQFYTWLYRIAINTAKNFLAAQGRRLQTIDVEGMDAEQIADIAGPTDDASPERLLLTAELKQTIDQAMADLPEELRTALLLREYEGLSYEEIAEVMECPIGTVRSRIFRAREAVDKRIEPLITR
ncbi:RNA polymerase sigma factor RpoE [Permianibacter aggregans]|uniref:RNA polymerase RpoE-like sigma-24 subunit n=1 Tax=Permianibacter aggregans TaxID=1510150 RepID=A0A4R6UXN4_9GAMM|nr:RNA polymerase sigma factor RpoE [Permianibacter aggregans]QGX41274.1 RNA polymerase sigma factor RpoE [Permianibacter aggregans]TDQ51056.1 RNA polymerase RpoE-like sigma-24 subunit [Permianibacter aggregans]